MQSLVGCIISIQLMLRYWDYMKQFLHRALGIVLVQFSDSVLHFTVTYVFSIGTQKPIMTSLHKK